MAIVPACGSAAAHLRLRHERVAILDIDVHHGNGTQGIFYARPDVLTVSIHADPCHFYPFVWDYAHERGEGAGLGADLNIPLPIGTGDEAHPTALANARQTIDAFALSVLATPCDRKLAGNRFSGRRTMQIRR